MSGVRLVSKSTAGWVKMMNRITVIALCAVVSGPIISESAYAVPFGSVLNEISDFQIIVTDPSGSMALLTADSTTDSSAILNTVTGIPSNPHPNTVSFSSTSDPFTVGAFPLSSVTVALPTVPVTPPTPGAVMDAFNMAGNPFRRPAPNPPPPFFPLAMSGDGEFEGNSAGLTFLNQLNFTIDVSPSPIGIQFAFSALISLIAESTAGIGVYSYATNAITILDTNNHNTIFNFSPSEISPSITANGGDVSTLNFVDFSQSTHNVARRRL